VLISQLIIVAARLVARDADNDPFRSRHGPPHRQYREARERQ
jgi:hypothetical protein